jgi:choline dehydrogenase-like flavoprotein
LILSSALTGFGQAHAAMMTQFPHVHGVIALLRDGVHPDSRGGSVALQADGSPLLDYPIADVLWDGARRALLSMAEIEFAAGARSVQPLHEMAGRYTSWAAARAGIGQLPFRSGLVKVLAAHVMGGCTMSDDERLGVVGADGRCHGVRKLSVHDGSLFPTSIGANPQLSIYGISARLASALAQALTGKPAPRASA